MNGEFVRLVHGQTPDLHVPEIGAIREVICCSYKSGIYGRSLTECVRGPASEFNWWSSFNWVCISMECWWRLLLFMEPFLGFWISVNVNIAIFFRGIISAGVILVHIIYTQLHSNNRGLIFMVPIYDTGIGFISFINLIYIPIHHSTIPSSNKHWRLKLFKNM